MRNLRALLQDTRAAGAAEFALVVPLLLILIFGVIDVGRLMYTINKAEKATQVGVRMAAVTTPVAPGLVNADFVSATLPAGQLIPHTMLGELVCTSTLCDCTDGSTCPVGAEGATSAQFNALVARMQQILPELEAADVRVTYRGSGFGFAGDALVTPGGGGGAGGGGEVMEISPIITVSIDGLSFRPTILFNQVDFNLPSFAASMTAEDASGTISN